MSLKIISRLEKLEQRELTRGEMNRLSAGENLNATWRTYSISIILFFPSLADLSTSCQFSATEEQLGEEEPK